MNKLLVLSFTFILSAPIWAQMKSKSSNAGSMGSGAMEREQSKSVPNNTYSSDLKEEAKGEMQAEEEFSDLEKKEMERKKEEEKKRMKEKRMEEESTEGISTP